MEIPQYWPWIVLALGIISAIVGFYLFYVNRRQRQAVVQPTATPETKRKQKPVFSIRRPVVPDRNAGSRFRTLKGGVRHFRIVGRVPTGVVLQHLATGKNTVICRGLPRSLRHAKAGTEFTIRGKNVILGLV